MGLSVFLNSFLPYIYGNRRAKVAEINGDMYRIHAFHSGCCIVAAF
jgi:hypothetical protein